MLRPEVQALYGMGKFPSYDDAEGVEVERVEEYQVALEGIRLPLSDEEAVLLCPLFGEDEFYGLAFRLRDLVESARSWPLWEAIDSASPAWQYTLTRRAENAGYRRSFTARY